MQSFHNEESTQKNFKIIYMIHLAYSMSNRKNANTPIAMGCVFLNMNQFHSIVHFLKHKVTKVHFGEELLYRSLFWKKTSCTSKFIS